MNKTNPGQRTLSCLMAVILTLGVAGLFQTNIYAANVYPFTLTAPKIELTVTSKTSGTGTLTVDSVPGSFPINQSTLSMDEEEYRWEICFSDGQKVYAVSSQHWKEKDSDTTGSLSSIQSSLWEINADGSGDIMAFISKPTTTETTIKWSFDNVGIDLDNIQYIGYSIRSSPSANIVNASYKIIDNTAQYLGDEFFTEYAFGSSSSVPEKPSSWAEAQVNAAITAKLVPSALQSKYTQATTRAEFCALAVALYETATGKEITDRKTFGDTNDINVEKAAAIGVVSGTGNNNFSPAQNLTREQAATMLSRLADTIGKPLTAQVPAFTDNASVSSWAADAVGQMQATGIMSGVGNNTFAPKNDYTREQSIVTIMRLFDIVK